MSYYHFPRKVLLKVPNFLRDFAFPFVKPLELLARFLFIFYSLRKARECKTKKKIDLKD